MLTDTQTRRWDALDTLAVSLESRPDAQIAELEQLARLGADSDACRRLATADRQQ
jgi:hypothetical protein